MKRWMGWLGFAAAMLAGAVPVTAAAATPKGYHATLMHDRHGGWVLDYRFDRAAPLWFFLRSQPGLDGKSWRGASWTVETPGVVLERIGGYDVLRSTKGPIRHVRIRVRPYDESLQADYSPFLMFSDGGVAVFDGHYAVAPLASREAAAALPADLNGVAFDSAPGRLTMRDPGHVLLRGGVRTRSSVRVDLDREPSYVYDGPAAPIESAAFVGIVDPGLPAWIREQLDRFTPQLFALYRERLGPPAGGRPMAMVAWAGGGNPGTSMGGSVLPGLVVMRIAGQQTLAPNPAVMNRLRWFFGHESAHFWMGQTVSYTRRSEAWITEGAADMLAIRASERLVPDFDTQRQLQREVDDCIAGSAGKSLAGASERGEGRTNYACGAALLIAVEGAVRRDTKADLFDWMRGLIDANRADGKVSEADWLAAFDAVVADAAQREAVRAFIDRGVGDPAAFLGALYEATGVAFTRDGARLVLR
ncbi:hypothetical protein ACX40Y_17570 [Sphingomonas sp. RS6]